MPIECITLRDPAVGSQAKIAVDFGFNCFKFIASIAGKEIDVLWSAPDFESGDARPSGNGIPLLFPFPGRLNGTTFEWDGHTYQVPEEDGCGNAIHGFVLNRPWRVVAHTESKVVGQFQASVDDSSVLEQWPADFRITATYELDGNTLRSSFLLENPDEKPLPCGFGTHPYFHLPLSGTNADVCIVRLPVTKHWELIDMLPTGHCKEIDGPARYDNGQPFAGMTFDDVFAGLQFSDGLCRSSINDPDGGVRLELAFGQSFRECVVYTPPHREAICIEPYTCVPGTFGMPDAVERYGLRVLSPGKSFAAEVTMRVE
ncbi:MAG: aldose epimerase [Planctomycetaceae bacterium]|nr:aldose epimerase [Planctomycetaceae bacterium]